MTAGAPHPSGRQPEWVETLYDRLANDEDGRVCEAIRDEACREAPGNFFKTLLANTLTSIGDRLASAKTTLPWLLAQLSAPAWCTSLLVPIRESGSMLPQMIIGSVVRRQPIRKWVWVAGSVLQGTSLMGMSGVALLLEGLTAGLAILILLVIFSLARGACSVAYKDVLGKTIPKTRRGRLKGWIGSVSGLGAMLVGGLLALTVDSEPESLRFYLLLLGGAALLWLAAAACYATIIEFPGETEGGRSGWNIGWERLALLRDDAPFRRFVVARALALGSALAAPFYVTLAREDLGSGSEYLGIFIAVEGLAGLVSGPVWGRYADRSSRLVFATACATASLLSALVACWSWLDFSPTAARWFYPAAFFGLGIAHSGVRLGRKTYLVDLAEGNRRTNYTAVSNTVMGALLLLSGAVGALAAWFSLQFAILLLAFAGFLGAAISLRWEEVSGTAK
jgi:MFS family permease